MANKKSNNSSNKLTDVIVSGKVKMCYHGTSKFSDKNKTRILLEDAVIPYDDIKAFEGNGEKLTPNWYKERNGSFQVSSMYSIKVRIDDPEADDELKDYNSLEDLLNNTDIVGSEVSIKCRQKDGALYPVAMVIKKMGTGVDYFEGM